MKNDSRVREGQPIVSIYSGTPADTETIATCLQYRGARILEASGIILLDPAMRIRAVECVPELYLAVH